MPGKVRTLASRLYRGEINYNFIANKKYWYTFSALLLLLSFVALGVRGLNLNIDFKGGAEFSVNQPKTCDETSAVEAVANLIGGEPQSQLLGRDEIQIQTDSLDESQRTAVQKRLAEVCGVDQVNADFVGPSWGRDISINALQGLVAFIVLVVVFLTIYFEWKMAMSAIIALVHDLIITIGIYALVGFEVTPSTVIGLLTVLGYSLYDTVVVFDKVKENTGGLQGGSRSTYSEAANLAVNQTLVRSINTSIVSILPVAAIFFVGTYFLGAGTLKDISLVLLIGLAAGAYSSILIAAPLLAQLKEREPAMQSLARRVAARRAAGKPAPAMAGGATTATLTSGGNDFADTEQEAASGGESRKITGNRNQPRRTASQQRRPPGKRGR